MAEVWDVVCGMRGDPDRWKSMIEYRGKRYYFCCDGCKGAFQRSPEYHLENFSREQRGIDPNPASR